MLAIKAHTECRFTTSLIPKLGKYMMVSSQLHALFALSQKKERQYPLERSLREPQSLSGRFRENSLGSAGNRSPVGPVHSNYTNWTILALIRNVELKL